MLGFFKKKDSCFGQVLLISEVMPVYAGMPPISNKQFCRINKVVENVAEGYSLGDIVERDLKGFYNKNKLLTQNGVPIKISDANLKKITQDDLFEKEGYKAGQAYTFSSMGFLENISSQVKTRKPVTSVVGGIVFFF